MINRFITYKIRVYIIYVYNPYMLKASLCLKFIEFELILYSICRLEETQSRRLICYGINLAHMSRTSRVMRTAVVI